MPFDETISTPDWNGLLRIAGNLPLPDPNWNAAMPNPDSIVKTPQYPLSGYTATEREEIQQQMLQKVDHLRNTSILVLGDSVDRNAVDHFGIMFQTPTTQESFNGSDFDPLNTKSWGYPHIFHVGGEINFTIASGFFYGAMDDVDDFSFVHDWVAPGKAEDRIEELFKVFTDRRQMEPSLIVLHSGMWDMAFFGRQDKASSTSTNTPLSDERLGQWQKRMVSTIRKVKETWPGVPIVLRKLHRVGPSQGAADWQLGQPQVVNYFTDIRFHQLRAMQQHIAQQEGIATFDFGALFEGFQRYQDKVHPLLYPGGVVMANGIMHQCYLAKHGPLYNTNPNAALPRSPRRSGEMYLRQSRLAAYLLDRTGKKSMEN